MPLTGFNGMVRRRDTVVMETSLFDDLGGLGRLSLDAPDVIEPVEVVGKVHRGREWKRTARTTDGSSSVTTSTGSPGVTREPGPHHHGLELRRVLWGNQPLAAGVVGHHHRDEATDRIAVSFLVGDHARPVGGHRP